MLGGLGLMLVRAAQIGDKRHVDEQTVLPANLQRNLPDGLQKRLRLNVADGTADFGDDDVCVGFLADGIDELLDLICNMRNDLNGRAKVFAAAFLVQNVPVDLAGG